VQPATIKPIAAHTVLNNMIFTSNKAATPVVIGGSTTVPTDAIRVQLSVTVSKGSAAGTLRVFPTGGTFAEGASLSWAAGQTVSSTVTERVGLNNEVTFLNQSNGAVTVLAKLTGYRNVVDATDITADGGNPGDVLVNTGSGAAWQATAPNAAQLGGIGPSGFIHGTGDMLNGYVSGSGHALLLSTSNSWSVFVDCGAISYDVFFQNNGATTPLVWWTHGGATGFSRMAPGNGAFLAASQTPNDVITVQASDGTHAATLVIGVRFDGPNNCTFAGQGISQ